jgi:hypothetical protein
MKIRAVVWGAVIVVGGIASYFTVSSGDAVKWNDKVVGLHNRFASSWTRLEPHLKPWVDGKAVDAAKLDPALTQYGREIAQAAAELRRQTPPDDELCKAMYVEMVKFADLQEAQLGDLKKLCGEMMQSNPGQPEVIKHVVESLDALGKKEAEQLAIVNSKQAAMAAKFKIKLVK